MQNYTNKEGPVYAGFFVRLAAYFLDALIVAMALLIVKLPYWFYVLIWQGTPLDREILFQFSIWDIMLYLLGKSYYILMLYSSGATVGKKAFRIRVVTADGKKPSFGNLVYRETIAKYLSQVLIFIGYLIIGPDREKKGLHDILCDTRVIYDFAGAAGCSNDPGKKEPSVQKPSQLKAMDGHGVLQTENFGASGAADKESGSQAEGRLYEQSRGSADAKMYASPADQDLGRKQIPPKYQAAEYGRPELLKEDQDIAAEDEVKEERDGV